MVGCLLILAATLLIVFYHRRHERKIESLLTIRPEQLQMINFPVVRGGGLESHSFMRVFLQLRKAGAIACFIAILNMQVRSPHLLVLLCCCLAQYLGSTCIESGKARLRNTLVALEPITEINTKWESSPLMEITATGSGRCVNQTWEQLVLLLCCRASSCVNAFFPLQ